MNSAAARGLDADLATLLLTQMSDYAIISLDAQGVITGWNLGATTLKGYEPDEALGRHFSMFYREEDKRAGLPMQLLEEARVIGRVEHTGWRVRKDGSHFWGDVIITALRDPVGEIVGYGKITRDLTDAHALSERLRESEARFRLLVSQVTDYAIIGLDLQGVIVSWNSGAEVLKGYAAHEAIGQHFSIFYESEDRKHGLPQSLLAQARRYGSVEHTGWRVRKNGRRFWGDVVITALHNEHGELTGYGKVTRDLSPQKRFEESRNQFFHNLSHDLRTPLTAIRGFVDLLEGAAPQEQSRLIERIIANIDRVNSLTDSIIQHAAWAAGEHTLNYGDCDLRAVVDRCVADLSSLCAGHTIQVRGPSVEATLDCRALERVVSNLVVNAVRYSAAGSTIDIEVGGDDSTAFIEVRDHGRGIHPDDLASIAKPRFRGRLAVEGDGGTGLGLASVATLVELHRGELDISSELGAGTCVTVKVPRQTARS